MYFVLSCIIYCMKLPCLLIKGWMWSWCSEVAGKQSQLSVVKIFEPMNQFPLVTPAQPFPAT